MAHVAAPKQQVRRVAQERKKLDPASTDITVRFSIGLRKLLDSKSIGPSEFVTRLNAAGCDLSIHSIKKYLNGSQLPQIETLMAMEQVLGLDDFRFELLPPPLKKRRKRVS